MLISELSGRANIVHRAGEIGVPLPPKGKEAQKLLEKVKDLESRGFQYENAEASFDLLVHRAQSSYTSPFELVDFMVVVESRRRSSTLHNGNEATISEAMVKVKVDGEIMHMVAEGNGPVNALDRALRKALLQFYPQLSVIELVDYKVRILNSLSTESQVRVLIESTDGADHWRTVGSSVNIIEASWLALADSLEYWLLKHK
jgi:2-isopropylmalate synthase